MKSVPRILPLVGIAIGGVLAVNALTGARDLPSLISGAQAFAEEAGKTGKPAGKADPKVKGEAAAALPAASITPKAVCAPTAAELARQAGLSPAELQVLQSLGTRRGQLDKRESDFSTQLALMAAAEAKLDAKIKTLTGLKGDVQGLLTQSNSKEAAEIDRLVKVFEGMKAKDAAPRLALLDDNVRIPIAAKMKERALSAIIAQMPATEAKKLTESLARRYGDAMSAAKKAEQVANSPAEVTAASESKAKPVKTAEVAPRKARARKTPATQQSAATPTPSVGAAATALPTTPETPAKTG